MSVEPITNDRDRGRKRDQTQGPDEHRRHDRVAALAEGEQRSGEHEQGDCRGEPTQLQSFLPSTASVADDQGHASGDEAGRQQRKEHRWQQLAQARGATSATALPPHAFNLPSFTPARRGPLCSGHLRSGSHHRRVHLPRYPRPVLARRRCADGHRRPRLSLRKTYRQALLVQILILGLLLALLGLINDSGLRTSASASERPSAATTGWRLATRRS